MIIAVGAIPRGYDWMEFGQDLLDWLLVNHPRVPPEGEATYSASVASRAKNGPLGLIVILRTMNLWDAGELFGSTLRFAR